MKKIKKIIAILSLAMMLGITAIPNYAYAMPSEENAAIDTVAAYVKENAEEFSDERTPIETIYFAIDKNGEMTIISGETETYKLVEDGKTTGVFLVTVDDPYVFIQIRIRPNIL